MTFYGIERRSDRRGENRVVAMASWPGSTARSPAGAVEWLTGSHRDLDGGDDQVALPGRRLYMAPKGWRRPRGRVDLPELAAAVEAACKEDEG